VVSGRLVGYHEALAAVVGILMIRIATIWIAGFLLTGCASNGQVEPERTLLSYSCGDSVVRGSLAKTVYGPTEPIEGDILGHGWFFADLNVQQHLTGSPVGDHLRVKYFGHAGLREDRDFIFILTPIEGEDDFLVRRSSLASYRPRLKNQCGDVR
jgi:hypothetical protein